MTFIIPVERPRRSKKLPRRERLKIMYDKVMKDAEMLAKMVSKEHQNDVHKRAD